MKKFLVSSALIALVATVFTGCIGGNVAAPGESPEDVVKEAFANLYDTQSHTFEAMADIDLVASGQAISGTVKLEGGQDMLDPTKPKVNLMIDFNGSAAGFDDQSGKAEVRMDGENIYFVLHNLSDFGGALPKEMVEGYFGKWFSMEVPPEAAKQFALAASEEYLTEEEKAFREFMKDKLFFKNIEYVGVASGNHHYKAELDKEAFVEVMVEATKMTGEQVSQGDIDDLNKALEQLEFKADIFIDPDKKIVVGMNGDIRLDMEGDAGDVHFEAVMGGFNEALEVEIPADATLFDPLMLLGPAMMMSGSEMGSYDDTMMGDDFTFDESMFDDSMMEEDYLAR